MFVNAEKAFYLVVLNHCLKDIGLEALSFGTDRADRREPLVGAFSERLF